MFIQSISPGDIRELGSFPSFYLDILDERHYLSCCRGIWYWTIYRLRDYQGSKVYDNPKTLEISSAGAGAMLKKHGIKLLPQK